MKHIFLFVPFLILAACAPTQDAEPVATDSLDVVDPLQQGMFTAYDADTDAALTQEEFVAGYTEANLVNAYDTDSDGALDEAEFTVYAAEHHPTATFATYDADGNGVVTAEEIAAGLFHALDADGDGRLTSAEFAAYEAQASAPAAEPVAEPSPEAPTQG